MAVDIWEWVWNKIDELYERDETMLAQAMGSISDWVHGDGVDAVVVPAVARARELGETWAEIYLRHWRLQNLIFYRTDLRKAAPEAASLLEFATRPENRDCPQSICVVDDFCAIFGAREGPAYARDCIAILGEAIDEIEVERACYDCLTSKLADAYIDAGEPEKVEDFLYRSGKHCALGPGFDVNILYHAQGRLAELKGDPAQLRRCAATYSKATEYRRIQANCLEAIACIREGKAGEALACLGDWDAVEKTFGSLGRVCGVVVDALHVGGPGVPDRTLWIERLDRAIRKLVETGANYKALDLAVRAAPILAEKGRDFAGALLDAVEPELGALREPERVRPRLDEARKALAEG